MTSWMCLINVFQWYLVSLRLSEYFSGTNLNTIQTILNTTEHYTIFVICIAIVLTLCFYIFAHIMWKYKYLIWFDFVCNAILEWCITLPFPSSTFLNVSFKWWPTQFKLLRVCRENEEWYQAFPRLAGCPVAGTLLPLAPILYGSA